MRAVRRTYGDRLRANGVRCYLHDECLMQRGAARSRRRMRLARRQCSLFALVCAFNVVARPLRYSLSAMLQQLA